MAPERGIVRADPFPLVDRKDTAELELAHPRAHEAVRSGDVGQDEPAVHEVRPTRRERQVHHVVLEERHPFGRVRSGAGDERLGRVETDRLRRSGGRGHQSRRMSRSAAEVEGQPRPAAYVLAQERRARRCPGLGHQVESTRRDVGVSEDVIGRAAHTFPFGNGRRRRATVPGSNVTAAGIHRTRGRRVGVDTELDELLASADRGMAVAWHAQRRPATPALITPAATVTYGELNERANRLARAFRRRGLRRGEGVALLCSNRPEFVEVLLATQRSGLRLTTVNWHLTPDEAGYIVDDCEARAFVAEARFADVAGGATAAASRAQVRLAVAGSLDGFEEYDAAVTAEPRGDVDDPALAYHTPAPS